MKSIINTSQDAGFTPFARYYLGEGSSRLFALASLGYSHRWSQYEFYNEILSRSTGYGSGSAGIGLVHFLTSQIGAEARLTYDGYAQKEYYVGSIQLNFGFKIYLPSSR